MTTGSEAGFGELRSALQAPPSAQGWERICKALRSWPDTTTRDEQAVPYVARALDSWPSALRVSQPWMAREALQRRSAMVSALCTRVELDNKLMPKQLTQLVDAGVFERTESLRLAAGANAQGEALILLTSDRLPALRELALEGQLLQDNHLRALASATTGPPIERLSLADNRLREDGPRRLAAWPGAARLVALDLSGNAWHPAGAPGEFALPALRSLKLKKMDIQHAELEWLLESSAIDRLDTLCLGSVYARIEGMQALLREPMCAGMKHFECDWVGMSGVPEEIDALRVVNTQRGVAWSEAIEAWVQATVAELEAMIEESYYDDDDWE
jgi:hypothetical protein